MATRFKRELEWLARDKYHGQRPAEFFVDAKRLAAGEPLDYLIGWKPFLNCRIDLSLKPFIPRPETEFWLEAAIAKIKKQRGRIKVLDLFSGSGALGVALAKNVAHAQVTCAEKEPRCLQQVRINLEKNKIPRSRGRALRSDVFSAVRGRYDFIVANPPYIPLTRKAKVAKGVLASEPAQALFGGADGLFFIQKFLRQAREHLQPNGEIWLEFDQQQKTALNRILKQLGYGQWQFYRDQYKCWRWVWIKIT